jgi:hypothetical protein
MTSFNSAVRMKREAAERDVCRDKLALLMLVMQRVAGYDDPIDHEEPCHDPVTPVLVNSWPPHAAALPRWQARAR